MKCVYCGSEMIWQSDFSFEDYGIDDEDGIVSIYMCPDDEDCKTTIEIYKGI